MHLAGGGAALGVVMVAAGALPDLWATLRLLVAMPGPAVVQLREKALGSAELHEALMWWASTAPEPAGLALVAPAQAVSALRAVVADVAELGALAAVFNEREQPAAFAYAERMWSLWPRPVGAPAPAAQPHTRPGCSKGGQKPWSHPLGQSVRRTAVQGSERGC